MSRYVVPVTLGQAQMHEGGNGELKRYFDRVFSYIPAEITAFYAAAVGAAAAEDHPSLRIGLEIAVLAVGFLFAGFPLYGKGEPKYRRIQIGIAMVAFLAWAYALNTGIVAEWHLYHTAIALIVLFVVSVVAGRYKPTIPAPPPPPPVAPAQS